MTNTYSLVTDAIVTALESNTVPWHKPWSVAGSPMNLVSRKPYRGINPLILGLRGFSSPWWLTYKQCSDLGGSVLRGSKASTVVFWNIGKVEKLVDGVLRVEKTFFLKHWSVFNTEQTVGLDVPSVVERVHSPIEEAEAIVKGYSGCPSIRWTGDRAFYHPMTDSVTMPSMASFNSAEEGYGTLFHELAHSTGHKTRLDREGISNFHRFGDENYSKEELVAEVTSCFLRAACGIEKAPVLANSAAYLRSWIKALKGDSRLIVHAAAQAQKAADYILGVQEDECK